MTRPATQGTTAERLGGLLRFQQEACRDIGSSIYDRLVGRMVERLDVAGPVGQLLNPRVEDPFGSALTLRFLGAVHRLVLQGRAPDLAEHYPSVGGRPGPGLEDAFEQVLSEHCDELAVLIESGVQTNEVGRSATLLGGLLEVAAEGLPMRVFEVGCSAGLNLRWDHFRYVAGDSAFGPVDSPVRFTEPWECLHPDLRVRVEVVERRGCDRSPIDPTTEPGRLTLRSFVWPDQIERFARLDAAIEVARAVPAAVDQADAVDWTVERLSERTSGTSTVVMHSIMLQYMASDSRAELLEVIDQAGRAATTKAPFAWLRMEPGPNGAELRIKRWPGAAERLASTSTYHGPPVNWLG